MLGQNIFEKQECRCLPPLRTKYQDLRKGIKRVKQNKRKPTLLLRFPFNMPWVTLIVCLFSKVLYLTSFHFPTLPIDFALFVLMEEKMLETILCTFFFFSFFKEESNTMPVAWVGRILRYEKGEKVYKHQKTSSEIFPSILYWISFLISKKKKVAVGTQNISAEGGREKGEWMLHFSIGPKSAQFTMGYIKSKHAMVILKLLLQYNIEVNSN